MTVVLSPEFVRGTCAEPDASGLTDAQLATIREVVRDEIGDLSVQFRHSTPFTEVRGTLRQRLEALRTVLAVGAPTPETVAAVADLLTDRAERLRSQRRHCDTPRFSERLRDEETELVAVAEALHGRF